tara:strand:- start:879 stop:3242 length:2364 start_codon:yes stop_codon:yes gene_type:complete
MQELDKIGEDLFNKIRGRFPSITIGNEESEVINDPSQARFFDFEYKESDKVLGNVSVNITEDEGMTVIFSKDFISNEDSLTKDNWYGFLKELRLFAKKRMLEFSIRDITKSNLTKRDYKFLSNRTGDNTMAESKLYGTSRISYQDVGSARLVIKHTESVNQEQATGRTRNVGTIYIESSEGERFKYPYKHLNGARAMARHVAEGGNAYDDFGKHIVSLSEEQAKLSKFKRYMSRSAVMAESLAEYNDAVNERIITVKKTLQNLQKKDYYAETFESFAPAVMEDVPTDVAENWIDQLTIKQFNEELKDIFPYVFKLVSEVTKAKELGPDDLAEVAGPDKCWPGHKKVGTQPGTGKNKGKRVNKCKKIEGTEEALEQGFEEMMGQFGEDRVDEAFPLIALVVAGARMALPALTRVGANIVVKGAKVAGAGAKVAGKTALKHPIGTGVGVGGVYVGKKAGDAIDAVGDMAADLAGDADALIAQASNGINAIKDQISAAIGNSGLLKVAQFASKYALPALAVVAILYGGKKIIDMLRGKGKEAEKMQTASIEEIEEALLHEAYINNAKDAIEVLGQLRGKGKQLERGQQEYKGNLPNEYVNDVWDVWTWMESKLGGGPEATDKKLKIIMDEVFRLRGEAKKMERIYKPDLEHNDEHMGAGVFANQIVNALYPLMQWIDMNEKQLEGDTMAVKIDKDGAISKDDGEAEEKQKTPIGEFILSYFDKETGEFPKGETAVLTMIEKDYGEQFIEPAKAFIEQVQAKFDEYRMKVQPQQMETDAEYDRMRELAGVR